MGDCNERHKYKTSGLGKWGNAFVTHSGLIIKQVLTVNAWLPSVLQWEVTNTPSDIKPAQVTTNAGALIPALVPSPQTGKLKRLADRQAEESQRWLLVLSFLGAAPFSEMLTSHLISVQG